MHTPSLRRRVLVSGVTVVALLLVGVDTFVYLTLRDQLEQTLDEVLEARVTLVRELAPLRSADDIAARLQALGVPAVVTNDAGDTERAEPATTRFGQGPPGPLGDVSYPRESQSIELGTGAVVTVFATRAGIETTLRRVLSLLGIATAAALAIAVVTFRRVADVAMQPLDQVVAAADRTAAGQTGERLAPDDPASELGRMAVSYDRMLDNLERALGEAQAAEERTRRFVDDAAHQLRTPLGAIRSSVEALLREVNPDVRDRLMSNLVGEAARSNRLLTSLLTLARLDQGRPPILSPTDLAALCRDEGSRGQSLAPELAVTCVVDRDVEGTWMLDGDGTREAVANVIDNARRHARTRITIRLGLVTAGADDPVLQVRIMDDGPGVAPRAHEIVFERFTTLDDRGGSGLGLPIARNLARAQGGDVIHRDGAFVIHLPARPGATPETTQR